MNPTLVGVGAGGAAGESRTRAGPRLARTDAFRVSANLDRVPRRLTRKAAGRDTTKMMPVEAITAITTERGTPKRRRAGVSARKRKEARTTPTAPPVADADPEGVEEDDAAALDDGASDPIPTTPEVSDDEGGAHWEDDDSANSAHSAARTNHQLTQRGGLGTTEPPPARARGTPSSHNDSDDDNEEYILAVLGDLNHDPKSVGSIFARQAQHERREGLDVAAKIWATTKQLLGEGSRAQKLTAALAAARERAYLVVMKGDRFVTLIHHLTIMDVELRPRDPIKGKLVAFEADMREDNNPPRLVVFDGPPEDLFGVLRPNLGSRRMADTTYAQAGPGDKRFLGVRDINDTSVDRPVATTRLIPIPMAWGAFFLDNPDFGVAVRRLDRLVDAIPRLERVQFAPIKDSLLLACYGDRVDDKVAYSCLSSDWDPLPLHPRTKTWMQEHWRLMTSAVDDEDCGQDSDLVDSRKMPARGGARPFVSQPTPPATAAASPRTRPPTAPPRGNAAFTLADLGPLVSKILQAQTDSNLQLQQSLQANMMANIRATAGALAGTNPAKDSKLSDTKLRILQACSGHGDSAQFTLSKFFADLDKNGLTSDNCGTGLRRLVVSVPGSAHRVNVHISPKVIAAVKTLNFSHNDDRTFVGCTNGITPFAVPWRTADAINEALADDRYFDEATLKTPEDIRKHVMAGAFEAPTSLQGLTRILSNYTRLLEVLFDAECPHLGYVVQLRDGLILHERVLESSITPTLMIQLLWKIHQDARQFFTLCERWDAGDILPHSHLGNTVRDLVADINISGTITCPVAQFLGPAPGAHKREAREAPRDKPPGPAGHGKQATKNSAIPALCAMVVQKFNRLHPTLDISSFVRRAGLRYADVKVGGAGDCTSFGLLGRCTETCRYRHRVITVPDERANAIKAALERGMAKLAADAGPA